jgi:large subunit ribosomal protein L4
MELTVYNRTGESTGRTVVLNDAVFGIEPNDHAIWLDVKRIMANRRQGTHKTKEKWEVAYSTRKIKKQKGTGGARAGSIKSPVFVGGGRAFGPQPRDYSIKLNHKVIQLARRSALTYKAQNEGIIVIEDFAFENPKTKEMISLKGNLKISDKKSLVVVPEPNKILHLSARNLKNTKVVMACDLNTYDVLNAATLVVFESSLKLLDGVFKV